MEDNKTRVLYDRLTQDGYDIGDFDSFSKNVQDEAKRKSLYETITNDGYDVGDFDSFSSKLVARSQEEPVTNVRTQNVLPEQLQVQPVQDMPSYDPKTQGYILDNVPDMFRSKGNNLATRPLPQQDLFENNPSDLVRKIGIDQQQRVEQAQKSANDPYMKEQNLELFKRQNQEQINSVNELINAARQERAKERQQRVRSVGDGGIFSTMSQAYLAGEQNDTDKQLEYASTLMEQAQNITNEAKKKGNTNFFAGFARGFKDAPLDGWAMGLQDLKNYSAAKKVMDKVDKGEELTPSEDALMQALVTNAATQMYYAGDLGRGYKAGGVTAESLPFMLDMIAGMGAVQALTKPASKAIVKYAADKAAQMGLGRATTGLAKGAARTVAGLGDVAAHTATFGSARVAADYQRRGLGDVQVKPNADGTVSYDGRENVQTGAEALGKSIISTAAETGSELLGEYFAPMLGYIGRVTGANKVGKIIPASVGKAFKDVVNSQGFREMQEIARRAKISDPLGEYAEEVANNLVSTAIGDMTPEQLVDLDQNIDTFLGVAPMSALFGAAGTGGYLRDRYKNYRNMRNFETQMQDAMGEDWSGVREALQDADIETARNMVKDVLSSPMSPDMKKNAIKYISSVLQEQTLQEADKQMMPEEIAFEKRNIINNLNETRSKISLNDEELNSIVNSEEGYQAIISQFDPETANNIMQYKQAYDDFVNYNYWVQDQADNARRQAEAQVESLTNATTGTIMRVNSGLSTNPVNILRGNLVFDNEGKIDENQSDKTIYYMSEDGRVKMAPVSMFSSLVDNTPAEEMIQRAGNDAQEEVLQAEEAQINSIPAQGQQPIGPETRFTMGGNSYEVNRVTPDGYEVYLLDENGTPAQSQLMSEEEIRNAINGQQPANAEETQPSVTEQPVQEETSEQPVQENQTAMSRIPLNERGEQDFETAPVADTSAALLEISDNVDDAKDTATQMIDHYNNELKKAEKAKSTGNTIQEIVKMKQEKKANIKAINDKISYWNQVAADLEAKRPTGLIAQAEEKAKENQQRLASMTAEEQQAAQQEVQKKIDAGAFERKEPRKKVRYVKEDADLGPSITPQEHVLREIATGRVSFSLSDTEGAQGLSSHLGYSNSPEEKKKLVWALSSDGLTPEAAAEQIHADMPENLQGMVTDQDVFNMIINAFQEYGSPSKMWDAAKNMHGTDIEENIPGYEEDQERQLIEWEASENRMSVPEWIAYSDYIEEELNNLYSSVTDEELNTIFEQIINDYERRTETESAGSTEGQTDSEQGNTVQPERESDNEGRTGEVEEQPEPANKTDGESGSVVPEPEGTVAHNVEIMSDQVTNNDLKIVHDAVGKTFRSKNGDLMTIENYRTNWDKRKKLHGVTYNFNGDVQKKSVFIAELANALTSGNWKEVDYNDSLTDPNKIKIDIEKAREEVDQNPTEAQKEAGNYKKGHVKIDGYDVTIENPKGSVRSGKDADGNEWSVTMNNDYGYIRGTEGVDGDHIDVFLSDNPETGDVFVIDQVNPDGTFDEHKVMYGFKSALAAKRAYMANYSKDWTGLGNITRVSKEEFKKWVNSSHRKTKPFAEYKSVVVVSEKETTTNAEDTPAKSNNIVSDERYQELKNRLKQKLGQLNAGIDPEIIAIGAEMAVYHIERGAVKFADYCKAMVDDLGDVIRPYLKSFYSSARYMPQSIENGLSERMSPDSEVSQFDVTNFDKSVPDVMQQIEDVAKEKEIEKATSSNDVKKSPSDLFGNSEEYQKKAEQEKEAVSIIGVKIAEKAIAKRNGEQVDPLTMKEVKDILKGYDMLSDMSATDMQELVELAMTNETRLIAESYINGDATKQKQGYDTIVDMYNMQPLLNARDSTRFERQQYSTPTPFGYVMGQFVKDGKTVESVLEPSAGNGALTIAFPANTVHVNDIDERRLENLRTLGYAQVTNQDALIPFEGSVDAVLTNPPFGSTTAKEFDDGQIKISSLEGLMAINALESMKDNGRAAIVIGGNTSYRDNGAMQSKDMKLFAYLYSHYNVVDVINLNGDMYKRNGTKYDVRIILINGRKTGPFKLIAPPVKSKSRAEQINSFEELYNRVQDDIRSLQQMGDLFNGTEGEARTTDTEGSGANNNVSNRPKSGERGKSVRPDKEVGSDNDMGSTGNTTVSGPEQAERSTAEENAGKLDNADRSDAGSVEPVQEQRGSDNGGSTGGSRNDGSVRSDSGDNTGRSRLSVNLSDEKVPYPNRSQSGTLMSVVPANQAQVLADSLANIGDVDQFLVDQLGYSSKDELFSYLAAEQIDSVSLAINQMNKGNGFIIGDMTGVGKGRQGAALIRYAVRKGYNPIYFTQKPALFSDNYRDLADIGSGDLRPFIIASDPKNAAITDASGNVVHKLPTDKEKKRVFDYIMKNGKLPEEYDYVITTYSQINNGTKEYEPKEDGIAEKDKSYKKKSPSAADKSGQERRDVIQALSKDNIMILDESHTAGGRGGGSMYMQYIMPKVKGVTFLSATFAKRADNMPIYAMKTDLSKSGISPQDMIEAISQGGVTLQEIMSKQLVQSGQMIRRERSFQGVTIDWMPVSEEEDAVQRKQFDEVSSIFSDIRAFQKDYITPIVEGISEELSEEGGYSDLQQGTAELGVTNTPFASKMYNLVNQLLFSLKADAVANRVIENLKNGFKPVISFTNTMEGFLDEAPKDTPMDKVPNFSATLMRALDGVMRYTETNLKGEKENKFFTVNDLPEAGQNKYYEIREKIENLSADLPISPMDAIKMKIQKAGYKVGEITGRTLEMVQDENGKYVIQNRKDRDMKSAARDFNNGQLDVLMVNKSGSTGISLHASPKFEDQRQRVMVFAQFQSDINDEVQMRGRIDRTGQKFRGKYEYIMSSIPAEQRLQMMFKAKLKSLDANTTSSQKSKFNEMEVVDYLNKYGDDVTWQYMLEHPELSEKLGDPLKILTSEGEEAQSGDTNTAGKEGCAAKIARYLPFLPVKEQEEVFKDITDAYNVKIQLLNDAGENDLEITTMPLKAKTISKKIWKPGTDPNSGNAFADNTYLEEVEVDVLKKPMKAEEIKSTVSRMTSGEPFNEWLDNRVKEINSLYDGKIATLKERLDQSALERSEKAKKNYIEKSKEARKNGKNEFTDEEIEKMSEVVVEDIMKKSKESFIKQKNVIEARRENIRKQINSFTPMKPLVIPFNLDETLVTIMPSRGMFLGYKFSKDYSPSSSTAIFATLDGRRKVEIPLNQEKAFNSIRMNTMMQPTYLKDLNVDTWDSYVPTQTRKKAYIVTGNLLQALVDTKKSENVKGYLVSYSTIEGDTKQGILMSDNFKPENLTTSAPISSRLIQIQQGETVISEDKRVIVEKNTGWRSGYALKVPKSKKQGGEFFEDNKLRSLADNKEFTTRGNYMVADISSDNLSKVLDRLSKMGVTVSKKAKLENSEDVRFREDYDTTFFRDVTDLDEIDRLEREPKIKVYRAMQVINGKLYPPMMAAINGQLVSPRELGTWEVADERPEAIKYTKKNKEGEDIGYVDLDKATKDATGKKATKVSNVAYNPYWHTSHTMLNDQFTSAWIRPNLVTVEVEVPLSELTSGYRAEYAKNSVGEVEWKSGPVSSQLAKLGKPRRVVLSRWDKPIRVVPESEVAQHIKDLLGDSGIEIPENVVTPKLKQELEKIGVKIGNPQKGIKKTEQIEDALQAGLMVDNSLISEKDQLLRYIEGEGKEVFNSDVRNTSQKLGLPVEIIHSIDEVPEGSAKEAIKKGRKVKGWYSLSDNKVYVYLPNATSMEDVNQTILHEGVAHYGLRQLVGEERMDDFLDDVFANVTDEVRKKIIDTLPRYGYNSRIATEEYMARMAENGVDVSVWQRIKQAFNSLMRRMGINIKISDNELRYILWRSRQNLDKNKPLDLAKDVAMQYQMGVGNYFREDTDGSIGMYEQSLKGWKYKAQEAYQDSMLALKNLQEVIAKVSGKPIKSFENAYMAENQLSSKNTSEAEVFYKKHYQPMLQEAGRMMKKYGLTQKGIERYMMLAHGIERNVELTFREQLDEVIKNNPDDADQFIQDFKDEKERLRKLYSGYEYLKELSDYIGGVNDYSATQAILNSMDGEEHDNFQEDALNYVKDFEQTYDVKELWNKTNDATKTTLRKAYDSGMMGKEQYSNVNNMYMYYVPLRGWDEQTAEDVYEYIDSERNPVSSVLKSAKGRKSIPDEIFATIGNMAESAIMQGNRNMMKQSFMSMVINHPTDIATLKKAWYVYDPVKDEWNISMPDIQESDNAETIAEKLKNHEEQMKQLKENGLATQKPNGLNINYRINKNNISQHVVQVKNGGKDYVIYINGNPRAAQAINGLTNPNVEQNPIFRSIATANKWLAANFTTRNPAFVLSNLVRDLIFSNVAVSIKEDGKYSSRFRKNILKAMPVVLRNLNGKPNNTEADRYFQEFIENGGETGYMHLNDVEKYKKKVRKELSKINGEMGSAKMAMDFAIDRLEDFNRWAEDISRFTTYMTSRQMGRSITESVNDAKEVTVNFNKKGAGYKTGGFFGITSGIFRNLYLFFNASVQSLTNFKRLYDKQPVKFYSALGGFMSAGFLMPMINNVLYSIFGGGNDDPYNDLPEWVRRNNFCIYTGNDTFLTIPLPIELRAFYGLGDYAYQLTTGKEKPSATNIAKGTVGQLADLLPLNPTGNEGLKTFMPDIMSPIFEAYVWNQDFTGKPVAKISPFNERDPEWKRVYKGTSGWLVDTSKFLNDISNGSGPGSEFRKGFIDFNPAKVEHLLESYFGGMAKTFNQAGKTIYYGGKSLIEQQKDEDLVMRNVPIANRFLNTVDERNAFSGINTEYFNLRDEMDQFKYELNGVKKSGNKDEYKEMLNSDLYDKYQKYKPYQKKLKKLNDMAKESQGEDRKEIEDMIIETRRELLEEVK